MTKHHRITCPTIKREMAAHKRALRRKGFEGLGWAPVNLANHYGKQRDYERKLIAYAAALAVKRGLIAEGDNIAARVMGGGLAVGTAGVNFYRLRSVQERPEAESFAHIVLRNLDWEPAEPVAELLAA